MTKQFLPTGFGTYVYRVTLTRSELIRVLISMSVYYDVKMIASDDTIPINWAYAFKNIPDSKSIVEICDGTRYSKIKPININDSRTFDVKKLLLPIVKEYADNGGLFDIVWVRN